MIDIAKDYGHIRALQGVSLAVRAGEVTCVLGDNGAGKSTPDQDHERPATRPTPA